MPHPNANADAAFVKGLYHQVLGRDGETTGITHRFCSLACRDRFREECPEEVGPPCIDGTEDYCNDGEVCCTCRADLGIPVLPI